MGGSRKVNLVKFLSWLNRRVDPLTELKPVATVDVEVMIARLPLSAEGVEDKTIRAEPVLWDVVETVVVFVALNRVGEVAVPLRTSEVGLGWGGEVNVRGFSGKETVIEEFGGDCCRPCRIGVGRVRVSLPAPPSFPHSLKPSLCPRFVDRARLMPRANIQPCPTFPKYSEFGNCASVVWWWKGWSKPQPAALSPHFPRPADAPGLH